MGSATCAARLLSSVCGITHILLFANSSWGSGSFSKCCHCQNKPSQDSPGMITCQLGHFRNRRKYSDLRDIFILALLGTGLRFKIMEVNSTKTYEIQKCGPNMYGILWTIGSQLICNTMVLPIAYFNDPSPGSFWLQKPISHFSSENKAKRASFTI